MILKINSAHKGLTHCPWQMYKKSLKRYVWLLMSAIISSLSCSLAHFLWNSTGKDIKDSKSILAMSCYLSRCRPTRMSPYDITRPQWVNNFRIHRNYANPVYGAAIICHQVRWLRWGHPSLFHIATSLLIWYKMFCVRGISYRLIWMEFINMFSVYAQSGTHSRFNW